MLLRMLCHAGFVLHYHGDFDWGGIRIANRILAEHQARPWRMTCDDYLAAVALGGRELKGNAAVASWDPSLSMSMSEQGVAIHEERVLATLLTDLQPNSDEG